jgi:hypothetical protein
MMQIIGIPEPQANQMNQYLTFRHKTLKRSFCPSIRAEHLHIHKFQIMIQGINPIKLPTFVDILDLRNQVSTVINQD